MYRVRVFFVALAFAVAGQSATAQAERRIDVVVSVPTANVGFFSLKALVSYDDLDISTAGGAGMLLDRINTAATRACTKRQKQEVPRIPAADYEACAKRGVADAVQRLNAPEVTRALQARKP